MVIRPSNRQLKMLRFFGVDAPERLSAGAAGWEIARLMEDVENSELWRRYLYLTEDFDVDSSELKLFRREHLETVSVPWDWNPSVAERLFREELVAQLLDGASPFDVPQPPVVFDGSTFVFTGRFEFGSRKACEAAVLQRGGALAPSETVTHLVDYLVVGAKGNLQWKRDTYGSKIEKAVLERRGHGTPAIISEKHWRAHVDTTQIANVGQ
jgi:NAD-dependent DNA ligase